MPSGFSEVVAFSGLVNPTAVRFAPNGQVFVAEKRGTVQVYDGLADSTPTQVADLRTEVYNNWDRGMLGLEVDPAYPTRPYVYVLYTFDGPVGGSAPRWGTAGADSDPCPNPPGATSDGCVVSAKLARLAVSGTTTTKQDLIHDWCQQYPSHSIGDLVFGRDGALYVSGGDGASFDFVDYGQKGNPLNPCGDPPGGVGGVMTAPSAEGGALRSQDLRTPADPVTLDGTVIRVSPDTGAALSDNPNASASDPNAKRIVAYGLRNPFRMTTRPGTDEVWVGDVGWSSYEEVNRIPNPKGGVLNFGWPCYEGNDRQGGYDNADLKICEDLYAAGNVDTKPYFPYRHGQPLNANDNCNVTRGSSTSGLSFQFYSGGSYPSEYDGALFFADYSRNCIWVMTKGTDGLPDKIKARPFVTGAAGPVDLELSPQGELFYVDLGGGTIRRIRHTGTQTPTDCQPPTGTDFAGLDIGSPAVAGSTSTSDGRWTISGGGADIWDVSDQFHYACRPLSGDGTITARVTSQTNTDPWAKAGLMVRASTAANAAHALVAVTPSNGVAFQFRSATGGTTAHIGGPSGTVPRWVRLTRSGTTITAATSADGTTWTTIGSTTDVDLGSSPRVGLAVTSHNNGTTSTATFEQVSLPGQSTNAAPTPEISVPASGTTWKVGDTINFSGSATDPEDGALPATALSWAMILHHCPSTDCHEHPLQTWPGVSSGSIAAPDHEYPSHLELRLTATDSEGASATVSRRLDPETVQITVATQPSGLQVSIGGSSGAAPLSRRLIVGSTTSVSAPSPQTLSGTIYEFTSWSDGGGPTHNITAGASDSTYTATYTPSGSSTGCPFGQYRAEYYSNRNLSGTPVSAGCETAPLDRDWGNSGPAGAGNNNFSARWTGTFDFVGGMTSFTANSDDGIRVWLDDTLIIDRWGGAGSSTSTRSVTAGPHTVRVEYYERTRSAYARVAW